MTTSPPTSDTDGTIHTVLVDDNEQWAEFIARNIEQESETIEVTVTLTANEAMLVLLEEDVDCIIADYQMPTVDGIQLLSRVRTNHSDLPFILVTSEGSEDIAATAIEAGVTDYLIKDPRTEQTLHFVNKIQTLVKQYRLQQTIEESELRYRTVTEQSRDAIGIIQNGSLLFCNQRMVELTGRNRDQLQTTDFISTCVHPTEQDRIRNTINRWVDSNEQRHIHELYIMQPDGTERYCEIAGQGITYEGATATLVSLRDITARMQRERELEWERTLNRNVQTALVESRTRADLEQSIVTQLRAQGYSLVWIAQEDNGILRPRVREGDTDYIDELDGSITASENSNEPSVWAARTGEPQFIQDFEDLFQTDWSASALAMGYCGGAALPLVHNDISYGVLVAYHDKPGRFDETEQTLLCELAETIAFAIHSLETRSALASDDIVNATVAVNDGSYYLIELAQNSAFSDCERVVVRGSVPYTDDSSIQYVTVEGGSPAEIPDRLAAHSAVSDVVRIGNDEPVRFQVTVTDPVPEMQLASAGAVVRTTEISTDGARIEVDILGDKDLSSIVKPLDDQFDSVSVRSVHQTPPEATSNAMEAAGLTAKQATALEAAFHHGYFERPRGSSATEIAEALDVSHSTFLQHLRRAEQKMFASQFS